MQLSTLFVNDVSMKRLIIACLEYLNYLHELYCNVKLKEESYV